MTLFDLIFLECLSPSLFICLQVDNIKNNKEFLFGFNKLRMNDLNLYHSYVDREYNSFLSLESSMIKLRWHSSVVGGSIINKGWNNRNASSFFIIMLSPEEANMVWIVIFFFFKVYKQAIDMSWWLIHYLRVVVLNVLKFCIHPDWDRRKTQPEPHQWSLFFYIWSIEWFLYIYNTLTTNDIIWFKVIAA
jgi:hypothetical protein